MEIRRYVMQKNDFTVKMPQGAKILSCRIQNGRLYIWALLVQTQAQKESRRFVCLEDNCPINFQAEKLNLIGTVPDIGTIAVYHIFEVLT